MESASAVARTVLLKILPMEIVDKILDHVYRDDHQDVLFFLTLRKYRISIWHNPSDRLIELCKERGTIQTGVVMCEQINGEDVAAISQIKFIDPWSIWKSYIYFRMTYLKRANRYGIDSTKITEDEITEYWKLKNPCAYGCPLCEKAFPCMNNILYKFPGVSYRHHNVSDRIVKLWEGEYYGNILDDID